MRTNLIAFALLLPAAGLAGAAEEAPPPAVTNAGFESPDKAEPSRWHWWSRTGQGQARRSETEPHAGKACAALAHDGPRDWAFSSETSFPVRPGQTYRATAWAKAGEGYVEMGVVARGQGKHVSWDVGTGPKHAANRWGRVDSLVEIPGGCDRVSIRFVGNGKTRAWVDDVSLEPYTPENTPSPPPVQGHTIKRVQEKLGRALVGLAVPGGHVYLSWRLLESDKADITFDVLRVRPGGQHQTLNKAPLGRTTDFLVADPPAGASEYYIKRHIPGPMGPAPRPSNIARVTPADKPEAFLAVKLPAGTTVQKIGLADLDGDGATDFVLKTPHDNVDPWYKYWKKSPGTYKLRAHAASGEFLWEYDMGWSIERGIWYSPCVVFDFDGDGKAEVAVKSGQGDPRDKEGKVQSGPEYVTILDGATGKPVTQADWPDRKLFTGAHAYNYASRNQMGVAYLDGKTPFLIVERGTYNLQIVDAYNYHGKKLHKVWRWTNQGLSRKYWGQGAHWMHCADVDGDGRDEVLLGSSVIDDNGKELWSTGQGHPDHFYLGDLDPARAGLEVYYGIETRRADANGMCLADARTGKILWGHKGPTRHVHGHGMCSDIDPKHPGAECFSTDTDAQKKAAWSRLRTAAGEVISEDAAWGFGPRTAYWDADPQREILRGSRIEKFTGCDAKKISTRRLPADIQGRFVAVADVLGDWREEIITSVPGELRIYITTLPAASRHACLLQDPLYRNNVAHATMGYYQVPMLRYDLASRR